MLIGYPYDPVTQDLWLYQDITISWTVPTPGSQVVKQPYAWNPSSPLYGYRNSLIGISARLRTLDTENVRIGTGTTAPYSTYNDPSNPVKRPVWYNSFPMTFLMLADGFAVSCAHCYSDFDIPRNPSVRLVGPGGYIINGRFDALFTASTRWLNADNSLRFAADPKNIVPFGSDTYQSIAFQMAVDLNVFECLDPSDVPPIIPVDCRSMSLGQTAWLLDSNHKVIRVRSVRNYVDSGDLRSLFKAVNPDGTESPVDVEVFLHDSGTFALAEIKPPTSAAAGDGVMGVLVASVKFPNELVGNQPLQQPMSPPTPGYLANKPGVSRNLYEYFSARGSPVNPLTFARRTGAHATETVEQQILSILT